MTKDGKKLWLFIPTLVLVNLLLLAPETFRERIFPWDGALFAANGAFFLSAFKDLGNDTDRRSRVLRTGNEISRPNEIMDSIKQNRIDIVVVESENLRKGASSGIYDLFHSKLGSIVRQEHLFKHLRDFPVLYGHPGKEEQLLLRVYSVGDGKKA